MDLDVPVDRAEATIEAKTQHHTPALHFPTLNELEGLGAIVPYIDRSLVDDVMAANGALDPPIAGLCAPRGMGATELRGVEPSQLGCAARRSIVHGGFARWS